MSKYDPLRTHLESQSLAELTLSFRQMEKIVGRPLPTTALRPHWWVNGTTTQKSMRPQVSAWTDAGYDALLIAGRKVRFKRAVGASPPSPKADINPSHAIVPRSAP